MFETKVGSDACLVLDGTFGDSGITINQSFTKEDLDKAAATRAVVLKVPIDGGAGIMTLYMNLVSTVVSEGVESIIFSAYTGDDSMVAQFFNTDGVWTYTV